MEFNWNRFSHLLQRDFILNYKKMLMSLVLLFLISLLAVIIGHNLINLKAGGGIQALLILFIFTLWIGGGWFTSTNLGDFQTSAKRIQYLSLPASNFEKLLSKWLYTLPIFILSISLIIWIFFKGYLIVFGSILPPEVIPLSKHMVQNIAFNLLKIYIFGHAVAFFCSFYFNRHVALKGALASIFTFLCSGFIWMLFKKDQGLGLIEKFELSISEFMTFLVEHPAIFLIASPLFWFLSFLILKRKPV